MRNNYRITIEDTLTGLLAEEYIQVTEFPEMTPETLAEFVRAFESTVISANKNPVRILSIVKCSEIYRWSRPKPKLG